MPALVAGIHVFRASQQDVDGRDAARPWDVERGACTAAQARATKKPACAGLSVRMSAVRAYWRAAVRWLKVTVDTKTTAVPANFWVVMPRCGSCANVIMTDASGLRR